MGRTNYIILAIGLAGVFLLSVLMKQVLHQADLGRAPVAHDLRAEFGDRLAQESVVSIVEGARGKRVAVVIHPVLGAAVPRLAQEVGHHLWRFFGVDQVEGVEVTCRWSGGREQRFDVVTPAAFGEHAWSTGRAPQKNSTTRKAAAPIPGHGAR